MAGERIRWRRTGPHTGLTQLNRPDRLNAMDDAAMERLHGLLAASEDIQEGLRTFVERRTRPGRDDD